MSKRILPDRATGLYVPKVSRRLADRARAVDLVTTKRMQDFDERVERVYAEAVETLREIRAIRNK